MSNDYKVYTDWYRQYGRDYYQSHKDKIRERARKRREENPLSRRTSQLAVAKCRAEKKGIAFDITMDDLVWPEVCPVFKTLLNYNATKPDPSSPSIDRIDPAKGYIKGNVWIISKRANLIKNDATVPELKSLVKALEEREREILLDKRDIFCAL